MSIKSVTQKEWDRWQSLKHYTCTEHGIIVKVHVYTCGGKSSTVHYKNKFWYSCTEHGIIVKVQMCVMYRRQSSIVHYKNKFWYSCTEKSIPFYVCKLLDLLQVTFHLAGKSLKIAVEDLVIIPYFESWYSRWNYEDKLDGFLPTTPEFQEDISHWETSLTMQRRRL